MLRNGFYTAVGTPLDEFGNIIKKSYEKHIKDQIDAGASGLLALGGMGIGVYVKNSEYAKIVDIAIKTAGSKCPVFIGVMDNSITRVKEKIDSLDGIQAEGIVATTPYYYPANQQDLISFFEGIAGLSKLPLYLYDIPGVTKTKIEVATVEHLFEKKAVFGIKTGDIYTAKMLMQSIGADNGLEILFSGTDLFDTAYKVGLKKQLDGMFACTGAVSKNMYESLAKDDLISAKKYYDDIILLRNTFVGVGVFSGFSYAMNLLGYEGNFAPDYLIKLTAEQKGKIRLCLEQIRMI